MYRKLATLALALLSFVDCGLARHSPRSYSVSAQPARIDGASPKPSAAPGAARPYQRRDTWYEFLLARFNRGDFDYGSWMEERRQTLLDASVRNPYFRYSTAVTVGLLLMATSYAKLWIDHRRAMWVTAEMMTDLYNHDAYSRRVAREAIDKYNEHIERCNRAIEAAEHGTSVASGDAESDNLRTLLQSVVGERDSYKRELDAAKDELLQKERFLTEMSLRLDTMAKKPEARFDSAIPDAVRSADQKLVHHINNLQEQLHAERRENKRLKGA